MKPENKITLNIPNATIVCAKELGKTDKEHQLIIPTKVLEEYPVGEQYKRDFTAFDKNGREWSFVLAARQVGDYEKPVICKAQWHQFVLAHNIGAIDGNYGVVFYEPHHEPHRLQVRALKKLPGAILGQPIWFEV